MVVWLGSLTDGVLHSAVCENAVCRCLGDSFAVALAIDICELTWPSRTTLYDTTQLGAVSYLYGSCEGESRRNKLTEHLGRPYTICKASGRGISNACTAVKVATAQPKRVVNLISL